jgi:TolB protein
VYIDIDQAGGYLLPIALPRFLGEAGDPALGQQLRAVLQEDLEMSGVFRIIDPALYIDTLPQTLDTLRYQNWAAVGALGVIVGSLQRSANDPQVTIELVLHDVVQQQPRFVGKQYRAPREQYREIAHRFSDLVFQSFTGEPGPFNTQVMCMSPRANGQKGKNITLMDYDGRGAQNVVADGVLNLMPILSPDGTTLAYTSYRDGSPNIYLRNIRTGMEQRLTSGPGLALPGSWSPDGRYLALNQTQDGNSDIYLYELATKRFSRLTTYWGIDVSPSFAPDSTRLVFTSDQNGSPQLYLTDVRGSPPVRLTFDGQYNTSPVWSPRDNTIAFVGRSETHTLDIYTIHADGSGYRRMTDGASRYESPTWSPNGRFVMYTSRQGDNWQRYMIRHDGQGNRQLPDAEVACIAPQWVARTTR